MPSPIKFNPTDLQDIITPLTRFVSLVHACTEILPQIDKDFIKKQTNHFNVLINDGVKRKDRKFNPKTDMLGGIEYSNTLVLNALKAGENLADIKKNLADQMQKGGYINGEYKGFPLEFFPSPNQKAKNCRIFIANNLIIQSDIQSSQPVMDFMRSHPEYAKEMMQKTALATIYAQKNPSCTQKDMDNFLLQHKQEILRQKTLNILHIPFIQLMENLRKFLFNTLISKHALQIASDEEAAKTLLKGDKDSIYTWAEQLGYIPDASLLIKYQHTRDRLAHPDQHKQTEGSTIANDATHIIQGFEHMLTHLMHGKNLKFSIVEAQNAPQTPLIQMPLHIDADDVNAYALMADLDTLDTLFKDYTLPKKANGKKVSGRKKLESLATLGVIAQSDVPTLESAIKARNEYAHGHLNPPSKATIVSSQAFVSNLLNTVSDHHQNQIGTH